MKSLDETGTFDKATTHVSRTTLYLNDLSIYQIDRHISIYIFNILKLYSISDFAAFKKRKKYIPTNLSMENLFDDVKMYKLNYTIKCDIENIISPRYEDIR